MSHRAVRGLNVIATSNGYKVYKFQLLFNFQHVQYKQRHDLLQLLKYNMMRQAIIVIPFVRCVVLCLHFMPDYITIK